MEDEKITLDMRSFKALASETRVSILKSLMKRRKMLTELSKELDMSPSTVKEHMESLTKAGLVVQIDDGHKWKYYELTRDGKNILNPSETRVWVVLGLSALAVIFTTWDMLRSTIPEPPAMFKSVTEEAFQSPVLTDVATGAGADAARNAAEVAVQIPYLHIIAIGVFTGIVGISLGYALAKKRWLRSF